MNCMKGYFAVFFTVCCLLFLWHEATAFPNEPVALVLQPKGYVQCSSTGNSWEIVYRNKFLFAGSHLKTGEDSSCILMNQTTRMTWTLEKNSQVEITADGIRLISGSLSEGEPASDLMGNLKRKFASVQKYTVILRSPKKDIPVRLQTADPIILCEEYPELVWENAGSQYSYELAAGDHVFQIPETEKDIVRFRLPPLPPGQYPYAVKVLHHGNVVYEPKEKNVLMWLPALENTSLRNGILSLNKFDSDNEFLLGNYLDEQGVKVAAMDKYTAFFEKNPDAQELKPFLIKIYDELKLIKMKEKEKQNFNNALK